jgi:hypothetical protein
MSTTSPFDALIGTWDTEGSVYGDDATTVVATVVGTDAYEWLGTAFVVHRIEVRMGDEAVAGLEMIGPVRPGEQEVPTQAYDGGGEIQSSVATVEPDGSFRFGADGARAHLRPAGPGVMTAAWERSPDNGHTWYPWMALTLTRR